MTDANASHSEPTKRKRGRPPGSTTEKRRRLVSTNEESDSDRPGSEAGNPYHAPVSSQPSQKLLQKYQEAMKIYEKSVFTSHMLHILRRIAAEHVLQSKSQQEPVLQQLMDVAKKLLMTELELVVWALHLSRASVEDLQMPLHTILMVSGFYVKGGLCAETVHIQAFLDKQSINFQRNFEVWEQRFPKETLAFTLNEVNEKWKQLNRPISDEDLPVINYNYYVDDILQAGVMPVDQFTSIESRPMWPQAIPQVPEVVELQPQTRPIKPVPTMTIYEPAFAKECEEFAYAPMQWFEQVPVSPGLLFFNFPSPPTSALLPPMDDNYESPAHFHV